MHEFYEIPCVDSFPMGIRLYIFGKYSKNVQLFASLLSIFLKHLSYSRFLQKIQNLEMKNSRDLVEKPHFAHSFTVILALITYHSSTVVPSQPHVHGIKFLNSHEFKHHFSSYCTWLLKTEHV